MLFRNENLPDSDSAEPCRGTAIKQMLPLPTGLDKVVAGGAFSRKVIPYYDTNFGTLLARAGTTTNQYPFVG